MPTIKVEPDDILDRLTEVFRTVGYDGATLSKLSQATGLQRASLYHRFPGGKKAMAEAVLAHAGAWLDTHVLAPLTGSGTPQARLQRMAQALDTFYVQGGKSCLLDSLSFGEGSALFHEHIRTAFAHWIEALAALVVESTGCPIAEARRRAEDAVLSIQGALVLARGTGKTQPFQRVLKKLPSLLLPARRSPAQRTP
jgi:TetR/AcrR family transcriptional regulator, lmrAB and yxaGH operons repressor